MNTFLRAMGAALCMSLTGCLTIPHLNQRSPLVSGRVIDIITAQPISDARVEFVENPALAVLTDEKGEFRIPASYKPELLVPVVGEPHSLDMFARIEPRLRVSRDGYEPREFDGYDPAFLDLERYTSQPTPASGNDLPVHLRPIVLARTTR